MIDIKKLKSELQKILENDLTLNGRLRPKQNLLYLLKNELSMLLLRLYSISDILNALNNLKLYVSDTTLIHFLKTYMPVEYEQNLKMRYFSDRIRQIKKVKLENKNISNKKLFEKLNFTGNINGRRFLNLTLEDFEFFLVNYFNLAGDIILDEIANQNKPEIDSSRITVDLEKDAKHKVEPAKYEIVDGNGDKKYIQFPDTDRGEFKNLKVDLDFIPVITLEEPKNPKAKAFKTMVETPLKNIPYCETFKYIRFATLSNCLDFYAYNHFDEERGEELRNKYQGHAIAKVLDDYGYFNPDFDDWESIPDNIIVHEGQYDWRDTDLYNYPALQYVEYDRQKEIISELYLYVRDLKSLNLIDFNTFKLVDGQAIIVNGQRDKYPFRMGNYDIYRYFNGEFYYMSGLNTTSGWSPSFTYNLEGYGGAWLDGQCRTAIDKYYFDKRDLKD